MAWRNEGRGSKDWEQEVDQMASEAWGSQDFCDFKRACHELCLYLAKPARQGKTSQQQKARCDKSLQESLCMYRFGGASAHSLCGLHLAYSASQACPGLRSTKATGAPH